MWLRKWTSCDRCGSDEHYLEDCDATDILDSDDLDVEY